MKYNRSHTAMDRVSMFTPMNLAGLARLGDDIGGSLELPADYTPPNAYDFGYTFDEATPSVPNDVSAPAGFNWTKTLDQAPAILRDLLLAHSQADATAKITDLNIARAKQGLPPVDPRAYGPTANVSVGVAPGTAKLFGLSLTSIALLAAGAYAMSRRR